MGNRGRYGKYGETKRLARLRMSGPKPKVNRGKPTVSRRKQRFYKVEDPNKERILIRPGMPSDVGFISSLSRTAFDLYGPYDVLLSQWFESGRVAALLALEGKSPAGFVMLGPPFSLEHLPDTGEILAIAVIAQKRAVGVGDRLMAEALKTAPHLGFKTLILHTAIDNEPAQSLFKKHGFTPVKIKRAFYPKGQDAIMMHLHLT